MPERIPRGYKIKMKLGWSQSLGFVLTVDQLARQIRMSCPRKIEQLSELLLSGQVIVKPKHVACEWFYELEPGETPAEGHPDRAECERLKSICRTACGLIIYMGNVIPEVVGPNNALCGNGGQPSNELCVGNPDPQPSSRTSPHGDVDQGARDGLAVWR